MSVPATQPGRHHQGKGIDLSESVIKGSSVSGFYRTVNPVLFTSTELGSPTRALFGVLNPMPLLTQA